MRPAIFAILGVVFGWSLMMIQPVFADTSSSSSFVLTDSFSIVGSPSDTSASYTQKGAGGFGANPVPLTTVPSSSNSNTRSRSSTSSGTASTSSSSQPEAIPTETPLDDKSTAVVTTPNTSADSVSTPPPDATTPSSQSGGSSILDRVLNTLDAAQKAITTPFRRSPATVPDVTPTQPTVVASTPSATRSTSTAQKGAEVVPTNTPSAAEVPSPISTPTQPAETPTKTSTIGGTIQRTVVGMRSRIQHGATSAFSTIRRATIIVKEKIIQAAHATTSWFRWIWNKAFSSAKKVEAAIRSAWVPAHTMASVPEGSDAITITVVEIPTPEFSYHAPLRKQSSQQWDQVDGQIDDFVGKANEVASVILNSFQDPRY